ncbi:MAG: flagellar type III secretion system pore protein FliP [Clostridiales bacterium]|nr:flagellar type III secretion system pore protein FliP [Clostridiales bacterium]
MEPQVLTLKKKTAKASLVGKKWFKLLLVSLVLLLFAAILAERAFAAPVSFSIDTGGGEGGFDSMKLLFTFALIAVAPSLLLMMTSFTRIVIVFSFLRNALGLQQTPPNQIIIGLSLFLSFFIMYPVITTMNETAITPYTNGEITQEEAIEKVQLPLKEFMLKQTKVQDLNLFLSLSEKEQITEINTEQLMQLGLEVVVPSFITSELKRAFLIGFLLFLPFLVIDMIVASTLMSMGMVMLPPSMISLPFKLMLFVVVDGWSLVMEMLIRSFY